MKKILFIGKEEDFKVKLEESLPKENYSIISVENDLIVGENNLIEYDLIIMDSVDCEDDGFMFLELVRKKHTKIPIIYISDNYDIGLNLQVIKAKATFFLVKPIDLFKLKEIINTIFLEGKKLFKENIEQLIICFFEEEAHKIEEKLKAGVFDFTFLKDSQKKLNPKYFTSIIFSAALSLFVTFFNARYGLIMIVEEEKLIIIAQEGFIYHLTNNQYEIDKEVNSWIRGQGTGIINMDTQDVERFKFMHQLDFKVKSQMFASLFIDTKKKGLIKLINKTDNTEFFQEELEELKRYIEDLGKILESIGFFDDEKVIYIYIIRQIIEWFEERIFKQPQHSKTVTNIAMKLAKALNLEEKQKQKTYYGAILHDIGKIGITREIFNKTDSLNKKEKFIIHKHPFVGRIILNSLGIVEDLSISDIIFYHHERYDGTGYPEGLKGEAIPLESRIISLADAYEVMCRGRIYKPKMSPIQIIVEIEKNAGTQFDPHLVKAFILLLKEKEI